MNLAMKTDFQDRSNVLALDVKSAIAFLVQTLKFCILYLMNLKRWYLTIQIGFLSFKVKV